MKIGILTYHCVPNFGAQLQALSTVGYLCKQGHTPVVINYYPKDLEEMYAARIPMPQVIIQTQFAEHNLPLTKRCFNESDIIKIINEEEIEGIIVGSDALFKYVPVVKRFHRMKRQIKKRHVLSIEKIKGNPFFGNFISFLPNGIKVSAFSVSSQNCPYKSMSFIERKRMRNALKNYSYISVRDKWTQEMVVDTIGWNTIKITPDPVFSFNQNCIKYIPTKNEVLAKYNLPQNYVLLSFSSWYVKPEYISEIGNCLVKESLCPVLLPMPEGECANIDIIHKIHLPLDPIDWYSLIIYSRGFIGERMHPIVVCLHNTIPFYSFDEYGVYKRTMTLKKEYIPESSKTFLVVKEAGLLNNLYSYKARCPLPNGIDVVKKLLCFDKTRCKHFSEAYFQQYRACMSDVLNSIV